ncbi:MAG TPA: phospholipase D-like domain-containing protein, partial [Burkholderiales bacterium]|nr:phospholipase D-like domain-containing protein [Burkholderiales bacterium]
MKISAEAWSARAVSLFEPGRNCASVVEAGRVSLLVDAEAYFRALRAACIEARESILVLGWDFNSRTRLDHGEPAGRDAPPPGLGEFLNWLAKRRRGLRIHVLIWDFPMVFGAAREWPPIFGFGWRAHRRVKVRYDNTHPPGGSQHQKIVVIDDAVAFCGGIDLTARRWDSCSHPAQDARRIWDGKPYAPYHDVMAMVDGEAAAALGEVARERWRAATGRTLAAPAPARGADRWPGEVTPQMTGALTAIARTIPETHPLGEAREVQALFLDMIAAAKDVIFIENQYFTSERLGDALARRLAEDDPPEVVVVTRLLSHGWLEAGTMETLRTGLVRKLRDADHKGRFGIYTPHVAGLEQGTCVDVHSKVTVVDDQWLRVGSANFSNRSMGFDTECDVAFEAGGNRAHRTAIREFRDGLIAEHLGVPVDEWRAALAAQGSLHAAIRRLQREDRTLKPLEDLPEPVAAMSAVAAVGDPERPVSLDLLVEQFSSDDAASGPARRGPAWGTIAAFGVAALAFALA